MKLQHLWIVPVLLVIFAGCGKKADTNKPVDQIKQEVQTMSAADIESQAKAYVDAINAKKAELGKVADQMKTISPTELLSEKANSLKTQLSGLEQEVSALMERYEVYAQKFSEVGGDLSKIKIG